MPEISIKSKIINILNIYYKYYRSLGDNRSYTYGRAINEINKSLEDSDDKEIIIRKTNNGIKGTGTAIKKKILDIVEIGEPENFNEFMIKVNSTVKSKNLHKHYQDRNKVELIIFKIIEYFKSNKLEYIITGSYRRERPEIGDIDIIVITEDLLSINENIVEIEGVRSISKGTEKLKFYVSNEHGEIEVDIRAGNSENIGAMILYYTGPADFNIRMRSYAKDKGFLLNEYGLKSGDKEYKFSNEKDIFEFLDFPYVEPKDRY